MVDALPVQPLDEVDTLELQRVFFLRAVQVDDAVLNILRSASRLDSSDCSIPGGVPDTLLAICRAQ